ncbi:MAG: NAD(P)/FAD-dependent oxidoreductase [Nocardioidaceae bacterium]
MTAGMKHGDSRPSVAVVGSGVSGLTAAYLLRRAYDVTLFEADDRLGGHAHSHDVTASDGNRHVVDTGFIVHNDRTYPLLRRLFTELGVDVRPTEMSMSVRCEECGLQFAGGRGTRGLLAQPRRLLSRAYPRMLLEVMRFHRRAADFLERSDPTDLTTYGEFLEEGCSPYFVRHYAVPVVSCVWSSGADTALRYPARYLFRFLDQHGMLGITGSPQWYTVVGGSRVYVERVAALLPDVRRHRAVTDIARHADGVQIRDVRGDVSEFDRVVLATHADQALSLLTDPTDDEVRVLKAFGYSTNEAVLHTDDRLLPDVPSARASWNYLVRGGEGPQDAAVVTYWMNRLQGHRAPEDLLVTLNAREHIDPDKVLDVMTYDHPAYTPEAVDAQRRLPALSGGRTAYAGAYHGWGFHEDGCRSGVEAARQFGVTW